MKDAEQNYNDGEAAQRRDEALRRALNMPPAPLKDKPKKRKPAK